MAVQMRQFDRVKEKVEIRLDNRQIAWTLAFGLAIAGAVFAAGYQLGLSSQPAATSDPTPSVLAAPTQPPASTQAGAAAAAMVKQGEAEPTDAKMTYTYDRVLRAESKDGAIQDPTMKAIQKARKRFEAEEAAAKAAENTNARATGGSEAGATRGAVAGREAAEEAPLDAPGLGRRLPEVAPDVAPAVPARPEREAKAAPEAAVRSTGYAIQVKAFRKRQEARQFIAALREAGYKPYLQAADVPGKGRFFRVRLGRYRSLSEATARQSAFEKAEGFSTIVTPI